MAKKSVKVALTYFITLLVTFIVFGGLGYYFINSYFSNEKKQDKNIPQMEQVVISNEYIPSESDRQTLLLLIDTEKRQTASCFMLIRLLPVERKLVIMAVPSDTLATVGGTENIIYEFYRTEGILKAVSAVENATGIKVDKYLKLNTESFSDLVDIFGGVEYDIPYNLIYENPSTGEETIFKEGTANLDSTMIRKLITYPSYKSGEEYRAKTFGIITEDLINKNVDSAFPSHIDDYFNAVINSEIETNISSYDYKEKAKALKYVAGNSDKIVQNVVVSGAYDENERFILDPNFVKSLTEWFKTYDYGNN